MVYILENTYLGEHCTLAVTKAGDLVQAFLAAPILIDGANLGAAAHRVRLFWTNKMPVQTFKLHSPNSYPLSHL